MPAKDYWPRADCLSYRNPNTPPMSCLRPRRSCLAILLAAGLAACAPVRDQAAWSGASAVAAVVALPGKANPEGRPARLVFTYANGDRLDAIVRNGRVVGPATVDYADGRRYRGEFRDNRIHGQGSLLYPNGDRYDGPFVDGRRHGQGRYRFASGGLYTGSFVDDQITGFGRFVYANGDRYDGYFLDGMQHGLGRLVSGRGRAAQEGRWERGRFVWPQPIDGF